MINNEIRDLVGALTFGCIALFSLCSSAQIAYGFEDCTPNHDRIMDIQANLLWCTDPANRAENNARERIIWGRYWGNEGVVRDAYGDCQRGHQAYQNYDFCSPASFLVAAIGTYPEAHRDRYANILKQSWGPQIDPPGTARNCQFSGNQDHAPYYCKITYPLPLNSQCTCPSSGNQTGKIVPN